MGCILNLFHIFLVAALLCILAKNLAVGNEGLQIFTYFTVLIMVLYHTYRIFTKTGTLCYT